MEFPRHLQMLIFSGRVLSGSRSLADYCITEDSTITCKIVNNSTATCTYSFESIEQIMQSMLMYETSTVDSNGIMSGEAQFNNIDFSLPLFAH